MGSRLPDGVTVTGGGDGGWIWPRPPPKTASAKSGRQTGGGVVGAMAHG
jgi:hypothetical protein